MKSPQPAPNERHLTTLWLGCLLLALLWDALGQDMTVMHWLGNERGFPWRDHPLLRNVLHDSWRQWAWGALGLLILWTVRPRDQGTWSPRERLSVLTGVLLSLVAINVVKWQSLTSCPWDLKAFGGTASYVSHWAWGLSDGGGGRCFPGGHASSALAFLAVALPGLARRQRQGALWLGAILTAGAVAGGVQTLRGAHYPSHTLWTLVLCLGTALLTRRLILRRHAETAAPQLSVRQGL